MMNFRLILVELILKGEANFCGDIRPQLILVVLMAKFPSVNLPIFVYVCEEVNPTLESFFITSVQGMKGVKAAQINTKNYL